MELHLVITISWSSLMQTHCIGYPHSHVAYINALDQCVCIKYKVSRIHSINRIRYPTLTLYYRLFKLILNIDPRHKIQHIVHDMHPSQGPHVVDINDWEEDVVGFFVDRELTSKIWLCRLVIFHPRRIEFAVHWAYHPTMSRSAISDLVIYYCTPPVGNPVIKGQRALIRNICIERIQRAKRNVEVPMHFPFCSHRLNFLFIQTLNPISNLAITINFVDLTISLAIRALVLPPIQDIETWLKFASLCRKNGKANQARSTLVKLLQVTVKTLVSQPYHRPFFILYYIPLSNHRPKTCLDFN
uniref:PIK-related kinase FAT domain-containing protein n=1 Tax=Cucumis melo TaxID=3656 RepID=A0A9I9ED55_CUCME